MSNGSTKDGIPCHVKICLPRCNCDVGYSRNDKDKCVETSKCSDIKDRDLDTMDKDDGFLDKDDDLLIILEI